MSIDRVEIGEHVLYCGSCADIMPSLQMVDAVVSDPMYGISKTDVGRKGNYTLKRDFFADDSEEGAIKSVQFCVDNLDPGSVFVFCGHRQFGRLVELLEESEFMTGFFAWTKTNSAPSVRKHIWRSCAELAVYGVKTGRFNWQDDEHAQNWRTIPTCTNGHPEKNGHPTQKPIGVMMPAVLATMPGETVLDFMMGSATTGVCCAQTGRRFVGIEKERQYFDVACRRMEEAEAIGSLFCPKENPDLFA